MAIPASVVFLVCWGGDRRSGEHAGDRTQDPRIKSALLYQLSYVLET